MKKIFAQILILIQLLTACASAPLQNNVEIAKVNELLGKGDHVRIIKVDGTSTDIFIKEVRGNGIVGFNDVFIDRKDMARIEKQNKSSELGAAEYASIGLIILLLPAMALCTVVTGDNRSSGPCGWGH
jgi:hypothetical protein